MPRLKAGKPSFFGKIWAPDVHPAVSSSLLLEMECGAVAYGA